MSDILIYGKDYKSACFALDALLSNFRYGDVEKVIKNNIYEVKMKDGTRYIAKTGVDSCRGLRFKKLYVDKRVPKEDINIISYGFWEGNEIVYF
jgi:hypothetical protein